LGYRKLKNLPLAIILTPDTKMSKFQTTPISRRSLLYIHHVDITCNEISMDMDEIIEFLEDDTHKGFVVFDQGVAQAFVIYTVDGSNVHVVKFGARPTSLGREALAEAVELLSATPSRNILISVPEYDTHTGGSKLSPFLVSIGFKFRSMSRDAFAHYGQKWDGLNFVLETGSVA
jgi:hypothetical protein